MTDERKPKWNIEVHASVKAAIVFIDMMKHARALEEKSEAVQQRLMIALLEFLEGNLGNYDCIHYNFTGDGALILFSTAESASRFCLGFTAIWQSKIIQLKKDGELPAELNIPFRTGMHYGEVYPLGPRFKHNLQYTSSQIDCTSRLLKLDKELADAKATMVATNIFANEASKKTGEKEFSWRKLDIPFKPIECLLPDGYTLYELGKCAESDSEKNLPQEKSDAEGSQKHSEYLEGWDCIQKKKYVNALNHFYKALMLDDSYQLAVFGIAFVLEAVGDKEGAIAEYKRAILLEPNDVDTYNNLSIILMEKGDFQEAIATLLRALAVNSNDADTHFNLACSYSLIKEYGQAITSLKHAIELDPNNKEQARTDTDFDSIRHLPEFKALVGESDGGDTGGIE